MSKLKMHTPDGTKDNIARIGDLFPNCVTEATDDKGNLKRVINLDMLRQELSDQVVEGPRERYQIDWPGKRAAVLTANVPIAKTLRPDAKQSKEFPTTRNLFIEGDNLDALKLLQETYLNKVKLIFIDPPYNTGKDFVYEDDFAEDSAEYLTRSNQADSLGNRLVANPESNGRFHSDWLSMIYPRIKLARNLLREDGVLFITIDDGEVANLRRICDEIFGESNFVANVAWQKKYAVSADDPGIAAMHDHILVYRKSEAFARKLLPRTDKQTERYTNLDNDPRGPWSSDNYVSNKSKTERPTLWYPIKHPKTGEDVWPSEDAVWRYSKITHAEIEKDGRLYWGPNQSYRKPRIKRFLAELPDGTVPSTWWEFESVGHNDEGQKETAELIGRKVFSTPKPVRLLKRIVYLATGGNDICLDFFAGSAATAHAVMAMNAEDGGQRQFIMVQLPEPCEENSEAARLGFKTIADVGMERVRKAGEAIKAEAGLNGDKLDVGFRVLKVDTSNMKDVYYQPDTVKQETLHGQVDNVKVDRKDEDLLFQVLLDWGVDLTLPVRTAKIKGKSVHFVDTNALAACFEPGIDEPFIRDLAKLQPLRAVFRDTGYGSDATKINVEQIFKLVSPGTEVKSI